MKETIISALKAINCDGVTPEILTDCCTGPEQIKYDERRKVFNRKFQFRPTAIVMCTLTGHVQAVMQLAGELNFEIRVRSGGHDHEGECSGTDTVVIDLSKMTAVNVEKQAGKNIARIQPGIVFKNLIPELTKQGVCIPHGTCGTVGIAGFTLGGGWGPWTRIHGMCCESLVGATIVLGNGDIKEVQQGDPLLWALRGGGGMSYGIITEFVFDAFDMPPNTIKFQVDWDSSPAYKVLCLWEGLIAPANNIKLIGTNLKIVAIPKPDGGDIKDSVHPCTFYGYYAGTQAELKADMQEWFASLPPTNITVPDDTTDASQMKAFETWDRISTPQLLSRLSRRNQPLLSLATLSGTAPLMLQDIPPDLDAPAPHKITSRLVKEKDWGDAGRENLLHTLESDLIYTAGMEAGVQCYVTLGAISGSYYANYVAPGFPDGSAFPYKKRPFTIQYQAWWDEPATVVADGGTDSNVHNYTNRAEDWIEECRSFDFPQTNGSFISFKDDAVPTRNYFLESYDELKNIKETYSEDPDNRLRTRKTII